jgi:hypothetical protein
MAANDVIRYFDLQSARRTTMPVAHGAGPAKRLPVLPQYFALVLGVVVQPYLQAYIQAGVWSVSIAAVAGRLAFGLILGAIAFPGIYKNAFDPDKPLFVQLCAIFAAGIGWQSIIQGGAKAALGIS